MPKLKKNIKKVAKENGLILGAVLTLTTIIAYVINWDIFLIPWFQVFKFVIVMIFAVYAVIVAKKSTAGKFSFRDGFSSFFITVAIALLALALVNWLLFDLLAPQAGHYINDTAIAMRKEQLQALEKDPKMIKKAMEQLHKTYQFSLLTQLKGYITNIVLYCIPALLVALMFKTKKPIITTS